MTAEVKIKRRENVILVLLFLVIAISIIAMIIEPKQAEGGGGIHAIYYRK